jgi:hypothetical protein
MALYLVWCLTNGVNRVMSDLLKKYKDQLPSNREIVESYGQIWDNVKHMKTLIKDLQIRYIEDNFI